MQFHSACLQELHDRGFIYQCTDYEKLDAAMAEGSITGYVGFDPTAKSLHVGNLVTIMMLRVFQRHGHTPIVIVGGGTAKIADPSGKDAMRRELSDDEIQENVESILSIYAQYIRFGESPSDAFVLNNDDWLKSLGYIEFLRDYGSLFTINRMLSFDSVKSRLDREQSLTFLEFNYMLLQAYDYWLLNREHNCTLQMGGSDQWGNIVNGVELIRKLNKREAFGLTAPLVTTASGEKMGKSAGNAIWLNEAQLPSYDYWQFWRNTDDKDVGRFLRMFTDLPLAEIAELEKLEGAELNKAKAILADEATKLARGEKALPAIHETVASLFKSKDTGYSLKGQDDNGNPIVETSLPVAHVPTSSFPIVVAELLVTAGLAGSKSEARRHIQAGAVKVDDAKVSDIAETATLPENHVLKLSVGKKKHAILIATQH